MTNVDDPVERRLEEAHERASMPSQKAVEKLRAQGKLLARERIAQLVDPDTWVEDGKLANAMAEGLPADGVVTGRGLIDGRPVVVVANDPAVKAGSWGARTVEKMIRATEAALRDELPLFWLVDSAGARITDQVAMFPGRRGAGRIFHNQVALSGKSPQICCLFGPSAAGGAYIPAFCDVVFMVEGNASMYLGSPRMAEVVIGEHVSLEDMGGARMHCTVSGCADNLADDDSQALELAKQFFSYLPLNWRHQSNVVESRPPSREWRADLIPERESQGFDVHQLIECVIDGESFLEIKPLFAPEVVVGFARLDGRAVGVVANNSARNGGVLFVDSSDKATRFISMCDAYNIPLIFLADVPGFMIGSAVERQGIIRHGAKLITAMSEATVPKFCVVVRKAYGAGLYAMAGPGFEPDVTLALPTASIAVMGPGPAVNAVYANTVDAIDDEQEKADFVAARRAEYEADVDLVRLSSDLVVDAVVAPADLRRELVLRLAAAAGKDRTTPAKRHGISPV